MGKKYVRKDLWREPASEELPIIKKYSQGAWSKVYLFFGPVAIILIELILLCYFNKLIICILPGLLLLALIICFCYILTHEGSKTGDVLVSKARVKTIIDKGFKYSGRKTVTVILQDNKEKKIEVMIWNVKNINVKDEVLLVKGTNGKKSVLSICESAKLK